MLNKTFLTFSNTVIIIFEDLSLVPTVKRRSGVLEKHDNFLEFFVVYHSWRGRKDLCQDNEDNWKIIVWLHKFLTVINLESLVKEAWLLLRPLQLHLKEGKTKKSPLKT